MFDSVNIAGTIGPSPDLRIRCPGCLHLVTLDITPAEDLRLQQEGRQIGQAGMRLCPNSNCKQFLFVLYYGGKVIEAYPAERIDFDASNIPPFVLAAFEEAISCHSIKCYVAAGIMVRKTLELLCEDRGATGGDLKQRISSLSSKVVLPRELLDGLDDLRLLGNDAAHVAAKTYQQIGKDEIEISIEFTKEVPKSVYQYSDLLDRLRSLKKP